MNPRRHFKTPERIRRANAAWRKAHPKRMAAYSQAWMQKHPASRLLISARHRAKVRGIEFDLTPDDVVIPDVCPALGLHLELGDGRAGSPGGRPFAMSLDRIDPTRGYVRGNVQVISHLANSMKSNATKEQLVMFAKWVLDQYGN